MVIIYEGVGFFTPGTKEQVMEVLAAQMRTAIQRWEDDGKPASNRDMPR